jgi:hypothetical protein
MLITRTASNVYIHGTPRFVFFPGANVVPDELASEIIKDKAFIAMQKAGMFVVSKDAKGDNLSELLASMAQQRAIETVKACLQVAQLEVVLALEKRAEVKMAIADQITFLKKMPDKKEKE